VGIITLDSILGAANLDPLLDALADSFIYLTAAHGTVTIINCQCEGFLNSINVSPSATGNISWPIVVLNSTLGDGVSLGHNCDYISIGNRYLPTSVHCNNDGNDVMIFSLGDIFAPNDPEVPLPAFDFQLQGNSRVVSRANRFRVDFQRPTRIGGQPGQPPANLPNIVQNPALALSPFSANGTQMALCDASGGKLFNLRADNEYVYFEDPRAHGGVRTLMRLDRGGNLTVKGAFTEDPDL
jgi:hypothetical protein